MNKQNEVISNDRAVEQRFATVMPMSQTLLFAMIAPKRQAAEIGVIFKKEKILNI